MGLDLDFFGVESMEVICRRVEGYVVHDIPCESETISDGLDLDKFIGNIQEYSVYKITKEECLFGRGNMILDIAFKDGLIVSLKYPIEMTGEQMDNFIRPLREKFLIKQDD